MRVLHVIADIGVSNGVMSVILNYAKAMPDDIKFDVVYLMDNPKDRRKDIEAYGGNVYKIGKSPLDVLKLKFYGFFKNHKDIWNVVHIHIPYFSAFIVPFAKLFGVKKVCCHCHSTLFSLNPKNVKINQILNIPTKFIVDKRFACGEKAGEYWYGKNYTVINNAVDCEKFKYDKDKRAKARETLGFKNELIIGHIGRTDIAQKNHSFLLEIFSFIRQSNSDARLMLIGGEKTDSLEEQCRKLRIDDSVLFLGSRADVDFLLQAVDVFVFPSTFEGLPVSVVEAQAAGIPVLMSDSITDEVVVTDELCKMSLTDAPSMWAEKAIELSKLKKKDNFEIMKSAGWDIFDSASRLVEYYRG